MFCTLCNRAPILVQGPLLYLIQRHTVLFTAVKSSIRCHMYSSILLYKHFFQGRISSYTQWSLYGRNWRLCSCVLWKSYSIRHIALPRRWKVVKKLLACSSLVVNRGISMTGVNIWLAVLWTLNMATTTVQVLLYGRYYYADCTSVQSTLQHWHY